MHELLLQSKIEELQRTHDCSFDEAIQLLLVETFDELVAFQDKIQMDVSN